MRTALALLVLALPLAACSTAASSTSVVVPTGIVVSADQVAGTRGCGKADGQVYKYVAAVASKDAPQQVLGASVYDCFADATFVNLTGTTGNYTVTVLAYDAAGYQANQAAIEGNPGALDALSGSARWKTTCDATLSPNVQVLAVCAPLQ